MPRHATHHAVGEPEVGEAPVRGKCDPRHVAHSKRAKEREECALKVSGSVEVERQGLDGCGSKDAEERVEPAGRAAQRPAARHGTVPNNT